MPLSCHVNSDLRACDPLSLSLINHSFYFSINYMRTVNGEECVLDRRRSFIYNFLLVLRLVLIMIYILLYISYNYNYNYI